MSAPFISPNEAPTPRRESLGEGARLLLTIAMGMLIIFGMRFAQAIILPVIMAGFLAIISYSITFALRKYLRFPHWLAVIFTVLVDFGFIFGIISLLNYLAVDFIETLKSGTLAASFALRYDEIMVILGNLSPDLQDQARALVKSPQDLFDPQQIVSLLQTLTGQVLTLLTLSALVLILMTFFLSEAPLFRRNLEKVALKKAPRSEGKEQLLKALGGIQRYLLIKTLSSVATGLLAWWVCAVMQVPFAFLWGVVACTLNFIPTFGSIVAAIPPILLAWLLGSWGDGVIIIAAYLGINIGIGNGIEPLFLGKQFGIATTMVLLSVLLWGWVFGPMGMLLAVPITVLIKLALETSRDLKWLSTLISSEEKSIATSDADTAENTDESAT